MESKAFWGSQCSHLISCIHSMLTLCSESLNFHIWWAHRRIHGHHKGCKWMEGENSGHLYCTYLLCSSVCPFASSDFTKLRTTKQWQESIKPSNEGLLSVNAQEAVLVKEEGCTPRERLQTKCRLSGLHCGKTQPWDWCFVSKSD